MSVCRNCFGARLAAVFLMALAVFAVAQAPSASAKKVKGCEIVDDPTVNHHTDCPGAFMNFANLHYADLNYANLTGTELQFADLSDADLRFADLSRTYLNYADLRRADLRSANLHGANLRWTSLDAANLSEANLSEANLTLANLEGADLHGANLSGANMYHTKFSSTTKFCITMMPDGSINNRDCDALGVKPPPSKSRTFVLAAATTRTFDVGYPSALKYKHAEYFCEARVSGPGERYVKILSHHSARGGTVCDVRARDNAKRAGPNATAKITVTATTVH